MKLAPRKADRMGSVVEQNPLLSKTAQEFIEGVLSADEYVESSRAEAEHDLEQQDVRRWELLKIVAVLGVLAYGVAAFLLASTQGTGAAVGAAALAVCFLSVSVLARSR